MLSGCAPSYSDVKGDFIVPEELKDCTFTKLETWNATSYLVIRCPNSQVSTTRNGKNGTRVNINID